MTPQSKEVHKEYMRKRREGSQNLTEGSQNTGFTSQGSQTPAIILALADPIKRDKLTRITRELKARHLLDKVYYGWSEVGKGITFTEIDKMLSVIGG